MARPNIDVFGQCINCNKNVLEERYIDGKIQRVFVADYEEVTYLLNDESEMRVSSCRTCNDNLDGTETDRVMKAVLDGWKHEVETYSNWSQVRKDSYLAKYSLLKIIVRSDNKDKEVLKKIFKESRVKKLKENK